ncbi:MAG: IS110 family transposase [Chlamydiales bacterium]
MHHYVGLDVSLKSTSICILDERGKRVLEGEELSTPESIGKFLEKTGLEIEQIGLETGNLTHYLKKGLLKMKYKVVAMETRKMAAILATIINKTDKNDARGIAEALRVGHFQECVHRSDEAVETRTLLHMRETLVEERTHNTNSIRGHLKVYGIKFSKSAGKGFRKIVEAAVVDLNPIIQKAVHGLLNVLDILDKEIQVLSKELQKIASEDEDAKLLQTIDGVGSITALTFKAEVDDPKRFESSKDVAAYIGLTPSQYSSGEVHRQGGISKKGSKRTRYLLVEAASVMLTRCKGWSKLKAWGMKLKKKKGSRKAIVAMARKLAVIMHRMLITRKPFERSSEKKEVVAA